jgi:hypothetical protein
MNTSGKATAKSIPAVSVLLIHSPGKIPTRISASRTQSSRTNARSVPPQFTARSPTDERGHDGDDQQIQCRAEDIGHRHGPEPVHETEGHGHRGHSGHREIDVSLPRALYLTHPWTIRTNWNRPVLGPSRMDDLELFIEGPCTSPLSDREIMNLATSIDSYVRLICPGCGPSATPVDRCRGRVRDARRGVPGDPERLPRDAADVRTVPPPGITGCRCLRRHMGRRFRLRTATHHPARRRGNHLLPSRSSAASGAMPPHGISPADPVRHHI